MRKTLTFVVIFFFMQTMFLCIVSPNSHTVMGDTPVYATTIMTDETWTLVNSPYWIEGNVFIDNAATLTIEAGVVVMFNCTGGEYGLTVTNGTLSAHGDPGARIWFTANASTTAESWQGISVDAKGRAELDYCNITYSKYALTLSGGGNSTVTNCTITDSYDGVRMYSSANNTIANSMISDCFNNAILLDTSSNNRIINNSIANNWFEGIFLTKSSSNDVMGNTLSDNRRAIFASGISGYVSEFNRISWNNIYLNREEGIRLQAFTSGNNITRNNISENIKWGVHCSGMQNQKNLFYQNIFWNNTNQANDTTGSNYWDAGYPIGGNYWSDFDEPGEGATDSFLGTAQNEPGSDGIADSWYMNIKGAAGTVDRYPLMTQDLGKIFVYLNSPLNNSMVVPGTNLDFIVVGDDVIFVNYSRNGEPNATLPQPWDIGTIGWPDGLYIIDIFVYDAQGNVTQSWFSITIDSIKPEIALISPPNASLVVPGTLIDLLVTDDNLRLANYTVNAGQNKSLSDPFDIDTTSWADGNYVIRVFAVDYAGNSNTTTYNFTLDGTGPGILFVDPGNDSIIVAGYVLQFSITDPHLDNSTIKYWIDGVGPQVFAVPYNISTTGWGDAVYTITVNASDTLGNNTSRDFVVTIDSIPPEILLMSPANNSVIQAGVALDFEILDENLLEVTYLKNLTGPNALSSPFDIDTSTWLDGKYNIDITATDKAGNTNWSYHNFTIATAPKIILNQPANNSLIKAGAVLDFMIIDQNLKTNGVNYSLDGAPDIILTDQYDISTQGWTDGSHIVVLNAIDEAGNANSSWYQFTVDGSLPTILFPWPGNNSCVNTGTILNFEVSDEDLSSVTYSINAGPQTPFTAPFDMDTTGWGDGIYDIELEAQDAAGNKKTSIFKVTIDSILPVIQLLSPDNGSLVETGTTVTLSIIDPNLDYVSYLVGLGPNQTLSFPFEINTIDFPEGDVDLWVYAQDLAGNLQIAVFHFILDDTTKPYITLNSPANGSHIHAGTFIDLTIFDLHLSDTSYTLDSGTPVSLTSPYDISTSTWSEGIHTLLIYAVDLRGNENTSTFFFTFDSIKPNISLISHASNSVILPGSILTFTVTDDHLANVNYSVNGQVASDFSQPFDLTAEWVDGSYTILVQASDEAGNTNANQFTIIIDSTPPQITLMAPQNNSVAPAGTAITFYIADSNLKQAEYSVNNGPFTPLPTSFVINTTGWVDGLYIIAVRAFDPPGNTASSSYNFRMDSTAPTIVSITAAEPYHPFDETIIIITFSEVMNQSSVEAALSVNPHLDYSISWGEDAKTLFLKNITGLKSSGSYAVDMEMTARDLAGNKLTTFEGYTFTALASRPSEPGEGSPLEFWWLVPFFIALVVVVLIILSRLRQKHEEPPQDVEKVEDIFLKMRAQEDIEAMNSYLKEGDLGDRTHEAELLFKKAKEAFEKGQYNAVTVYERTLRDLIKAGDGGEREPVSPPHGDSKDE